jgi:cellulose synthase operon protein C
MVTRVLGLGAVALFTLLVALPPGRADSPTSPGPSAASQVADGLRGEEARLRDALKDNPKDAATHLELAELYLKMANFPDAEAEAREAARDGASDEDVAPVLAETLFKERKSEELFRDVIPGSRTPRSEAKVRLYLGLGHFYMGEVDEAEPLLRDAQQLDPANYAPSLALAELYAGKGDLPGAEAALAAAKKAAPDNADVIRLEAGLLMVKKDNAGALTLLNQILAKNPDDVGALLDRSRLYFASGDQARATADLDHAYKVAPADLRVISQGAMLLASRGRYKEADQLLATAGSEIQYNLNALYLQGVVKFALGQYAQAEDILTRYAARRPKEAEPVRILAEIALQRRDAAAAIRLIKPVVDADPSDDASVQLLARAYVAAGRPNDAMELLQSAAAAHPNDASAQVRLAFAELQLGQSNAGVAELAKLEQSQKDLGGPLLVMADLRLGRLADAAAAAQAMVARDPNDVIAETSLGIVRMVQHDYPQAQKIFAALVEKYPDAMQAERNLAQTYYDMGRRDDAEATWNDLLKKKPDDAPALLGLAQIAEDKNRLDDAALLLQRAEIASPKDPAPGMKRMRIFALEKNWAKAIDVGRELARRFPDNPDIVELIARAHADAGDTKSAVAEFQPLMLGNPTSPVIYEVYARYQAMAGDGPGALDSLAKAVSLAPHDLDAMERLAQMTFELKGAAAALAAARSFAAADPVAATLVEADILVADKRPDEALATVRAAEAKTPSPLFAIRISDLLAARGSAKDALSVLTTWLATHADDLAVRRALATLEMKAGEYDEAAAELETIVAARPADAASLNDLAWLYQRKSDPRARGLAERSYALAPTPQAADTLGWILTGDGEAARAVTFLRPALQGMPDDPTVKYHLAAALSAAGGRDEARTLLESIVNSQVSFDGKADAARLLSDLTRG